MYVFWYDIDTHLLHEIGYDIVTIRNRWEVLFLASGIRSGPNKESSCLLIVNCFGASSCCSHSADARNFTSRRKKSKKNAKKI